MSLVAFVLTAAGVVATVAVVAGSGQDASQVLWPIVFTLLVATAISVSVPRRPLRIVAAVAVAGMCLVGAASVGIFFVPAAFAAVAAATMRGREA